MKYPDSWIRGHCDSPLGPLLLAASPKGLAGVWFTERQRDTPRGTDWAAQPGHPVLREAATQLTDFFLGQRHHFELPLDLAQGTPFQQAVWHALLTIPFGQTVSYGELAARIGRPRAVRALGGAVGDNPISIVVPCHRVIGARGALTGYGGGLDRKTALLRLEGVLP